MGNFDPVPANRQFTETKLEGIARTENALFLRGF
jgi:hypothetical protein